jgi:hypothetical protein
MKECKSIEVMNSPQMLIPQALQVWSRIQRSNQKVSKCCARNEMDSIRGRFKALLIVKTHRLITARETPILPQGQDRKADSGAFDEVYIKEKFHCRNGRYSVARAIEKQQQTSYLRN